MRRARTSTHIPVRILDDSQWLYDYYSNPDDEKIRKDIRTKSRELREKLLKKILAQQNSCPNVLSHEEEKTADTKKEIINMMRQGREERTPEKTQDFKTCYMITNKCFSQIMTHAHVWMRAQRSNKPFGYATTGFS